MPFSHFPGAGRGGFIPPVDPTRTDGFTVNGFIVPVDARRHGRSRKPFGICSCKKRARNSPGMCSYKTKHLNFPEINTYKKMAVGGDAPEGYSGTFITLP